jgi:hypothetical protein
MTTTALLTNKAYGYPTRGARRRRKPTILACFHQTANAKATAMQERNYASEPGARMSIARWRGSEFGTNSTKPDTTRRASARRVAPGAEPPLSRQSRAALCARG